MMFATLFATAYCADNEIPSLDPDFDVTNFTVAFLAIAPAHSTSSDDSTQSFEPTPPGSAPLVIIVGLFAGSPALVRNVCTSDIVISTRPTTAMVCPLPVMLSL